MEFLDFLDSIMSPVRASRPINQPPLYQSSSLSTLENCLCFAKSYIRSANLVPETPYTPLCLFLTRDGILGDSIISPVRASRPINQPPLYQTCSLSTLRNCLCFAKSYTERRIWSLKRLICSSVYF
jgi:hypothetical protein